MAQDTSVEVVLNNTRETLKALGDSIENLASKYPEIFQNPDLSERLENFRAAHEEATERLKTPRLSIATIGTTSSGKSTIVNALIGRKLAPIEAGEMSGGVLTLCHSEENRLVVEPTEGATWETGEWTDLTDEEIYDRIRNSVMLPYHQARRKKGKKIIAAPQVTVFGPLLPAVETNLLGLPPGIGIEFIDLPGLKSVQDKTNVAVIQNRVKKAFSLVALDYMQVDDEHRKRLLEELKEVVSFLQGRTDSMVFILNRVDQRGSDDLPLSERIQSLRKEIKKVLVLKRLPDVLAFSARILYYGQCAVGLGNQLQDVPEERFQFLESLFQDCAKEIKHKVKGNKELKRWVRKLEDQVDDSESITQEDLNKFLSHVREWSGGQELWDCLNQRLQESFPTLVLAPIIFPVCISYEALSSRLDTVAEIRQIEHKEQVEAKQKEISEIKAQLQSGIEQLRKKTQDDLAGKIEFLKKSDPNSQSTIAQNFEAIGLSGFEPLLTAIDDIEVDLARLIVRPVREALLKNQPRHELEEIISTSVPPNIAEDLGRAYDVASRRIRGFKEEDGFLVGRALKDKEEDIKELDNDEKSVRKLFLIMRKVLTVRAEFQLQTKAMELEEALLDLIQSAENQLTSLCSQQISDSTLQEAILSAYKSQESVEMPALPSQFFNIKPNIQRSKSEETKVVGKEWVTETYTTGTCFKSEQRREVKKDKKELLEYKTVVIPNINLMAEAWQEGIQKGKDELWDILCDWMTQRLDLANEHFNTSVEKTILLAEQTLEEQLEIIAADYAQEMKKWQRIQILKSNSSCHENTLKTISSNT